MPRTASRSTFRQAWRTAFRRSPTTAKLLYQMGHHYVPEAARGVRWDDPAFAIEWPPVAGERVISDKDFSYADFEPLRAAERPTVP